MNKYKVLVVDDDSSVANNIANALKDSKLGIDCFITDNGTTAIDAAKEKKPDLIIANWELPGMSGIKLVEILKGDPFLKAIPVIIITETMTSPKQLKKAFDAGANDFIKKPVDKLELVARTSSMLKLANSCKKIVEIKNRELTSTAMYIMQNNELFSKIVKQLKKIDVKYGAKNKTLQREISELVFEISQKIKSDTWTEFEMYFNNVHPDFFIKLVSKYPKLTPAEIKLGALIRLGLSSKEIAAINYISVESIKTSRSRLRKKMGLSIDDNLMTFLISV